MSTPTPRTDAQAYGVEGTAEGSTEEYRVGPRLIHVSADFARTLERELHESRNAERLARVQLGNERARLDDLLSINATGAARLAHERERSRLLLAAMKERDNGYIESRKRMSALESELTAKSQGVRNLAEVISGQDKELAREREKVRVLRLACERIVEQWDKNHDAAPFHAGNVMYSRASAALAATEDAQ